MTIKYISLPKNDDPECDCVWLIPLRREILDVTECVQHNNEPEETT